MRQSWSEQDELTVMRMVRAGARPADIASVLGSTVQAVKDRAVALNLLFKPPKPETQPVGGHCKSKCSEASACCLRGDVKHTLHICRLDCPCHAESRYLAAKRARETKRGQRAR